MSVYVSVFLGCLILFSPFIVFLVCLVMLLGYLCLVVVFVSCNLFVVCLVVIVVSVLLCILSKVHWFCLLFSVLCFFVEFYFK